MGEGVAIGVDLGGTTLAGGLVDAGGKVLAHLQEPTHGRGPGTALAALVDLVGRLADVAHARRLAVAEVVDGVCQALGAGLAVIVNGLNPERLLLAGSVAKSLRPLERQVRGWLERYAFARALATTRIEILDRDKDATVRGGAALLRYETERRAGR